MEKLKNLLELSSLPGVPTLLKAKYKLVSFIWLISIIFLSVSTIFLIITEIKSYFDYKIITNIDVIREDESQFPTVSFCLRYTNNNNNSINQFELKNILTNCQFNLIQCNWTDFEVYSLTFNNVTEKCFRFNSGYDYFKNTTKSIQTINTNDLSSGLNLAFSLDYFLIQSFNDFTHIIPFKLFLFIQNNTLVFRRDHAYKIETGLQLPSGITYISIVKKLIQKLPKPYNDCIKQNTKEYVSDLFQYFKQINKTYLQTDCIDECIRKKMEYNCTNKSSSLLINEIDCYTNLFYKYRLKKIKFPQECYDKCPLECDINDFKIEQTYMGKMKDDRSLNISIYFKTLDYLFIKQIKKSNPVDLISNIGSILGLFIGLNFFNFIELFQIIVSFIIDR